MNFPSTLHFWSALPLESNILIMGEVENQQEKKYINDLNMMLLQNIAIVNVLWNPVVIAKMVISF